jgi:hypothetical protein
VVVESMGGGLGFEADRWRVVEGFEGGAAAGVRMGQRCELAVVLKAPWGVASALKWLPGLLEDDVVDDQR